MVTISCMVQWLGSMLCDGNLPRRYFLSNRFHQVSYKLGRGVQLRGLEALSLIVPNKPIELGFLLAS
jgi:hypothetical protein